MVPSALSVHPQGQLISSFRSLLKCRVLRKVCSDLSILKKKEGHPSPLAADFICHIIDFNSFTAFRILFICQTCFCCYSSPSPINWNVSSKRIGILSVLFSPGFQCKEHCLHVAGSPKWFLELLICSFPSLSSASANGVTCSPYLYLNQKVGIHP